MPRTAIERVEAAVIAPPSAEANWYAGGGYATISPFGDSSRAFSMSDIGFLLDIAGNTSTSAILAIGGSASSAIDIAGDQDWFQVSLVAGETYQFSLVWLENSFDSAAYNPLLRLLDGSGSLITSDDDSGLSTNSVIFFTAGSTGTFYVSAGGTLANNGGRYSISAAVVGADIAETTGTAASLAVGGSLTSAISSVFDHDWVAINLDAGQSYFFGMSGVGASRVENSSIAIRDSAGTILASSSGGGAAGNAYLSFTVGSAGTYYLDASVLSGVSLGSYSLTALLAGADTISADTLTTGTITVGGSLQGALQTVGDQDWYAVQLTAGTSYRFFLEGTGGVGVFDTFLRLHDAAGVQVSFDDDSGIQFNSLMTFTAGVTGTYFVSAGGFGDSYFGSYNLSVQVGSGVDYVGQTTGTAGALAQGATVQGTINTTSDQDWYQVTLTAGEHYVFRLTNADGLLNDPLLRLMSSAGAQLVVAQEGAGDNFSALHFTPTTSGTYYISAQGFDTGDFNLTFNTGAQSNPLDMINWGTSLPTASATVYFATAGQSFAGATADRNWTQLEIDAAMQAFGMYSNVTNLTFTQVFSSVGATFTLLVENLGAGGFGAMFPPATGPNTGVGLFNLQEMYNTRSTSLAPGSFVFTTLMHEFGHGLGLAHPHDAGGFSDVGQGNAGNSANGSGSLGAFALNQGVYTVMSYNLGFRGNQSPGPYDQGIQASLMAFDIAVLQARYGANTTFHNGDDTYTLVDANVAGTGYVCIWDTGGTDAIAYNGSRGSTIDLRAATLLLEDGGGGRLSAASTINGGFLIANGVVIENGSGGSGADTLIGNSANNTLNGNDGADVLRGGLGNDTLSGGAGSDTASYSDATAGVGVDLTVAGAQGTGMGSDTLTSIENLQGSAFGDFLTGNGVDNILMGGTGDDTLSGGGGSDTASYADATVGVSVSLAVGGAQNTNWGNDTLTSIENLIGSAFNDTLTGDGLDNVLQGGLGNDSLSGGAGNDTATYEAAGSGVTVNLGLVSGQFTGGAGTDTLASMENVLGSAFNDTLIGNADGNLLIGADGNDTLHGNTAGADTLNGGNGVDWAWFQTAAAGVSISLAIAGAQATSVGMVTLIGIENLMGSTGDDTLTGDAGVNVISGAAGNDTIYGGSGDDQLNGHGGSDVIDGQGEYDTVLYNDASGRVFVQLAWEWASEEIGTQDRLFSIESVVGSSFSDVLIGWTGSNAINGGMGNDWIEDVGDGNDVFHGELGNDIVWGGVGDDQLFGDDNHDALLGGIGNDSLDGGTGNDWIYAGQGADAVIGGAGNDVLFGAEGGGPDANSDAADVINGGDGDDSLIGEGGNDFLVGGNGIDWIYGGAGADTIFGDNQDDVLIGGDGASGPDLADTIDGGLGNDSLIGQAGDDVLTAGDGNDWAYGGANNDSITGGNGNDVLAGEDGDDFITGGAGNDFLFGGNGNDVLDGGDGGDWIEGSFGGSVITGGLGADVLSGGDAARFVYNSTAESTEAAADVIRIFWRPGGDKIDVSAIDADGNGANGNTAFTFVSAFSNVAGQAIINYNGTDSVARFDTNGDGLADMAIVVLGMELIAADIIL